MLLPVALLTAATATVLANAGRLTLRRLPRGRGRLAGKLFAAWWLGAAASAALMGAHAWLALAGVTSDAAHEALLDATALPLCASICCLVCYLAYLYFGARRAFAPLGAAYFLFYGFTLYVYNAMGPWRVSVGAWDVALQPTTPHPVLLAVFGALFALPVLACTIAYASLIVRAPAGEPRWRLTLVSLAFGVLFGTILAGFALGLQDKPYYSFVYDVPALAAALLVQVGYVPPARVRARFAASS